MPIPLLLLCCITFIIKAQQHDHQGPFYCGMFDFQFQAGGAPVQWQHRGALYGVTHSTADPLTWYDIAVRSKKSDDCDGDNPTPNANIIKGLCFPEFKQLFDTPWTVGGQLGYAYTENTRLYLEGNYFRAAAKSPAHTQFCVLPETGAPEGTTLNLFMHTYIFFDAHIGARYYSDRFLCNLFSLFVGAKVGLTHYQQSCFAVQETIADLFFNLNIISPKSPVPLFKSTTTVSGGINGGVDIAITNCWNLVLTAEVVASAGPRLNAIIPVTPDFPINIGNVIITPLHTELRFPVTVAIRYSY